MRGYLGGGNDDNNNDAPKGEVSPCAALSRDDKEEGEGVGMTKGGDPSATLGMTRRRGRDDTWGSRDDKEKGGARAPRVRDLLLDKRGDPEDGNGTDDGST